MRCMPAVSDRHLERHHKQVPKAVIVTASGRFTMMDHFRQASSSGFILQRYEMVYRKEGRKVARKTERKEGKQKERKKTESLQTFFCQVRSFIDPAPQVLKGSREQQGEKHKERKSAFMILKSTSQIYNYTHLSPFTRKRELSRPLFYIRPDFLFNYMIFLNC